MIRRAAAAAWRFIWDGVLLSHRARAACFACAAASIIRATPTDGGLRPLLMDIGAICWTAWALREAKAYWHEGVTFRLLPPETAGGGGGPKKAAETLAPKLEPETPSARCN